MEQWRRDVELLGNAVWNSEHHSMLLKRIEVNVWHKLTAEEQAAFLELLESCHWGPAEVERAKAIVETATWFSKLGAR